MLVVKNEGSSPYIFDKSRNAKSLDPGSIVVLSDTEWASIPFTLRGPGKLNPLWPNESNSESEKINIEYYSPGGMSTTTYQVHYMGQAPQTALDADQVWTIKKYSHVEVVAGDVRIAQIQVLPRVAWSDRATLPWT